MKLRGKLIVFVIIISLLGIFTISSINYFVSIRRYEDQVEESSNLEAISIAKDIDKMDGSGANSIYICFGRNDKLRSYR